MRQAEKVKKFIKQQGGLNAAADTLGVHISSLWRWKTGAASLTGPALVAVDAVLRHPGEYKEFPDKAVKQGRPKGV